MIVQFGRYVSLLAYLVRIRRHFLSAGVGRDRVQSCGRGGPSGRHRNVHQRAEDLAVYCRWSTGRLSLPNANKEGDQRMSRALVFLHPGTEYSCSSGLNGSNSLIYRHGSGIKLLQANST